jgi:hypothetical protein
MATFVSKDCKAWVGQYALHGSLNRIDLSDATEPQDETVFGSDSRIHKPGLAVIAASYAGFFSAGTGEIDDALQAVRGTGDTIVSLAPTTGAVGERCYTFRALHSEIRREGQVGELALINAAAVSSSGDPLVPGYVLHNDTQTATGTGTAVEAGAVAASQFLYAALHVLSASGTAPTLDVVVQSDDGSGMATPTNRITFTQVTAAGTQWATPVAGAITDTFWRPSFTIGGTSPSFEFVLVIGII